MTFIATVTNIYFISLAAMLDFEVRVGDWCIHTCPVRLDFIQLAWKVRFECAIELCELWSANKPLSRFG